MQQYSDVVLIADVPGGQVRAPASATVQVNVNGGGIATIYSDDGVTPKTNPITTDSSGEYAFFAADGLYDLVISVSGFTSETKTAAVLLFDSNGAFGLTIGNTANAGTIVFPPRAVGRGQNIIATHDLGPFLGDPDPTLRIGYNYTQTGNLSVPGEPGAQFCIEGYYNDGSGQPKIEMYWQVDGMTGQGAEFRRPIFAIANRATSNIQVQTGADTVTFGDRSLTDTIAQVLYVNRGAGPSKEILVGTLSPLGAPGYNGFRANGTSGGYFDVMANGARIGTIFADSAFLGIQSGAALPIRFFTAPISSEQVRITNTTSANRYITLTGSNGGDPNIGTSAGNLSITPAVVVTAATGSAIGVATSTSTVLNLPAGTTAASSVRLAHGAAPTSPVNGDMWTTTAGLFVRVNGSTVGPLS